MTVRTAGEFVSSGPAVGRWLVSALAVVLAHGFVIFALLPRVDEADPDAGSPAIYIELAPVTAAPEMTPADLPPGPPEQEQRDRIDASVQPKPQEKPVTEAQQTPDSPELPPAAAPQGRTRDDAATGSLGGLDGDGAARRRRSGGNGRRAGAGTPGAVRFGDGPALAARARRPT